MEAPGGPASGCGGRGPGGRGCLAAGPQRKADDGRETTGVLLAGLGTAVVGGDLQGLLAVPLMLGVYVRKIVLEEDLLLRSLGDAYAANRRRVAALIVL